jgi:hypothetical protein
VSRLNGFKWTRRRIAEALRGIAEPEVTVIFAGGFVGQPVHGRPPDSGNFSGFSDPSYGSDASGAFTVHTATSVLRILSRQPHRPSRSACFCLLPALCGPFFSGQVTRCHAAAR